MPFGGFSSAQRVALHPPTATLGFSCPGSAEPVSTVHLLSDFQTVVPPVAYLICSPLPCGFMSFNKKNLIRVLIVKRVKTGDMLILSF